MNYFIKVFTSEDAGAQKPNPSIFKHALKNANATEEDSIMIGDDLQVDILGAKGYGLDQVYFNPKKEKHSELITHEIIMRMFGKLEFHNGDCYCGECDTRLFAELKSL